MQGRSACMDAVPVKFGDSSSNGSRDIQQRCRRGVIFGRFSNVHNFRPEVRSDVISGVIIDPTGVKVCVKFGDSRSNRLRYFVRTTTMANGPDPMTIFGVLPQKITDSVDSHIANYQHSIDDHVTTQKYFLFANGASVTVVSVLSFVCFCRYLWYHLKYKSAIVHFNMLFCMRYFQAWHFLFNLLHYWLSRFGSVLVKHEPHAMVGNGLFWSQK